MIFETVEIIVPASPVSEEYQLRKIQHLLSLLFSTMAFAGCATGPVSFNSEIRSDKDSGKLTLNCLQSTTGRCYFMLDNEQIEVKSGDTTTINGASSVVYACVTAERQASCTRGPLMPGAQLKHSGYRSFAGMYSEATTATKPASWA